MVETNPVGALPPSPLAPTPGEAGPSTAWRLATSPATGVGLGLAIALQLALAGALPDDLPQRELARAVGFGRAEVLTGLGVADPLGSWLFWLLWLLVALHLAARAIAARQTASRRAPDRLPEGLTLVALGVGGLLAGRVAHLGEGLDARVAVRAGGQAVALGEVEVAPGVIVPRALPFSVACAPPDPLDPGFALACTLDAAGERTALELSPGRFEEAAGLTVSLVEAAWTAPTATPGSPEAAAGFLWTPAGGPLRLALTPGATHAVGDPARPLTVEAGLTAGAASHWLVKRAGTAEAPALLWPASGSEEGATFEALAPLEVTLRVESRPGRALTTVALGLVLLGLLVGAWPTRRRVA
jgi:hypothetical protein